MLEKAVGKESEVIVQVERKLDVSEVEKFIERYKFKKKELGYLNFKTRDGII